MLLEGGGSPGAVSQGQRGKEFEELRERLLISENLMTEMSKTWEEKLKETERVHQVSTLYVVNVLGGCSSCCVVSVLYMCE